jgi:GNAT superfamily N-acetyltransferase
MAVIRPARREDAAVLAELGNLLNAEEGMPVAMTAERLAEDGFGPRPAFRALLAEREGVAVGYALFHDCYNTDVPGRGVWLADLYLRSEARGLGIGRALVAAVAAETVATGGVSVWWSVRSANRRARAFYAGLGARDEDARVLELDGAALLGLAEEAGRAG